MGINVLADDDGVVDDDAQGDDEGEEGEDDGKSYDYEDIMEMDRDELEELVEDDEDIDIDPEDFKDTKKGLRQFREAVCEELELEEEEDNGNEGDEDPECFGVEFNEKDECEDDCPQDTYTRCMKAFQKSEKKDKKRGRRSRR